MCRTENIAGTDVAFVSVTSSEFVAGHSEQSIIIIPSYTAPDGAAWVPGDFTEVQWTAHENKPDTITVNLLKLASATG